MPITFGELVQEVINEVRAKEQAFGIVQKQQERIKELEAEIATLAKANAAHVCTVPAVNENVVREPDKPKLVPVVKEIK